MSIYLIGSLRNPQVPAIAKRLRDEGHDVFDDWYSAGPEADDKWRDYETGRGRSYLEALDGYAAGHVFAFDKHHLVRAVSVVLVLPAGKSGHLELGFSLGMGKKGYILLDNPDRWDVMYKFADGVFDNVDSLVKELSPHYGCMNCDSGLPELTVNNECVECGRIGNERSEVGPILSGDGSVCFYCKQGPIYEDWCSYCCTQQLGR